MGESDAESRQRGHAVKSRFRDLNGERGEAFTAKAQSPRRRMKKGWGRRNNEKIERNEKETADDG
jgi:hypothetical protein